MSRAWFDAKFLTGQSPDPCSFTVEKLSEGLQAEEGLRLTLPSQSSECRLTSAVDLSPPDVLLFQTPFY